MAKVIDMQAARERLRGGGWATATPTQIADDIASLIRDFEASNERPAFEYRAYPVGWCRHGTPPQAMPCYFCGPRDCGPREIERP